MAFPAPHHRFTTTEYEQMGATGILTEDDRVELIVGEIVDMSPFDSRHVYSVNELNWDLGRQLGNAARISVQNPVLLSRDSEPQPDIAVLRPRGDYVQSLPTAADVLLLVEVANSSLVYDRDVKVPLYAPAGIPEVWLVNLRGDEITRYAEPQDGACARIDTFRWGERITSVTLQGLIVTVDDILG